MSMDSIRWQRVQTIFHEALALAEADRKTYLETECGEDQKLLADVMALLETDKAGHSLLDEKQEALASRLFDGSVPYIQTIGHYRVKGILGKGGMGVVYLGEHKTLNRSVAIKVLRDASLSPARRDRFEREQKVLAQLIHPSIARLYEANVLPDGTPYFVMEYVEGVPITTYCNMKAPGIRERLLLFRAVCEAVQYAHRQAVIHRDLKPSNIFAKTDGTVSLLDFGIAKQIEDLDDSTLQTHTGLRMMTPAYAAPEQLRGGNVGVYTDVYGLGVLLYELLTGQLPFDISGLTPGKAEILITDHQPEKPSEKARQTDMAAGAGKQAWDDLDVLCLTAMHKDLRRRYVTVESLIRDLDHYLKGEPLEARPDTMRYRTDKFLKRNRRAITTTALLLVVLLGVAAYYTYQLASSRDAALAEMAKTQRIQQFVLNLFEGGDEMVGPSDSLRVITLVEEGVREAGALDSEPDIQAATFLTLGGIYQKLGNFERADSLIRMSLEKRKRYFGTDHPEVAEGIVALGILRTDQAELEEAGHLLNEGVELTRKHYPAFHPATLKAMTALGKLRQAKGDYEGAISILTEAEQLQSGREPATRERALTLSELANTYFYAGHYDMSDSLNHMLLEMNRELYGDRHPHVADDLINIGAIRFQKGYFEEAERYYREALDIKMGFYGPDHHKTASNLTMLGRVLVLQERYEEGREILNRSLAIQEQVYGSVHPRIASVLNELATVAYKLGDTDVAIAHYKRMAAIYDDTYEEPHYLMGIARSNLAGVYFGEGLYELAESLMREAVGFFTETLSSQHLDTGIGRIRLGRILIAQGRYKDAETELLAGYEILSGQTNPSISWLRLARTGLAEVYRTLGRPEMALQFENEPK